MDLQTEIINGQARVLTEISGHPDAALLFNELVQFYGGPIHVNPSFGETSSYECPVYLKPTRDAIEWPPTRTPTITVALNTGRELEAACHEMLHLKLPILGYAKFCLNTAPPHPSRGWDQLTMAVNQIEHQVMLPEFLRLGFAANRFLRTPNSLPRLEQHLERFADTDLIANPRNWSQAISDFFKNEEYGCGLFWGEFEDRNWRVLPVHHTA